MIPQFTKRQHEILKAAIDLIAEQGIQRATTKNIALRVGVTEAALYRHFPSKVDILLSILQLFHGMAKNCLSEVQQSQSAILALETLFKNFLGIFTQQPAFSAVIFSEEIFQDDPRLSDEVLAIMNNNQQSLIQILKKGQAVKTVRSDITGEELALIIMGTLRLLVTRWRLSGYHFNLDKKGIDLWQTLARIIK